MNTLDLATEPFALATVVISDAYVDTFPHPDGLIAYLQRLFLQMNVDILSLQKPVTVKGKWNTMMKIDAFLKTLVSTLQSAITQGVVPSEEDFHAVFTHFEQGRTVVPTSQNSMKESENDENAVSVSNEPVDNCMRGAHTEQNTNDIDLIEQKCSTTTSVTESRVVISQSRDYHSRKLWYHNTSTKAKTSPRSRKNYLNMPEPFVVIDDALQYKDATSSNLSNISTQELSELEQELSQLYTRETLEKYQKVLHWKELKNSGSAGFSNECKNPNQDGVNISGNTEFPKEHKSESLISSDVSPNIPVKRSERSKKPKNEICRVSEIDNSQSKSKDVGASKNKTTTTKKTAFEQDDSGSSADNNLEKCKQTVLSKRRRLSRRKKYSSDDKKDILRTSKSEILQNHFHDKTKTEKEISKDDSNKVPRKTKRILRITKKADVDRLEDENKSHESINDQYRKRQNRSTENYVRKKQGRPKKYKKGEKIISPKRRLKKEADFSPELEAEGSFECKECSYEAKKQAHLTEHIKRVHLKKMYKCAECTKEFGFQKDLNRHRKCHKEAKHCCDSCGKMYKEPRSLLEHKKIHEENYVKPEFPCKFCGKAFSTKYVLGYHIKSEHLGVKKLFVCPTCGKSFSQKNSYLQHANVHLGIKPYTCEICSKSFSYEKSLKEHKFMHSDEKAFSCNICGKSFRQASGLAIHSKIHKTEKDYVCSMCGRGFSQKQALVRHERIHAGEKPYECLLCSNHFADSSVLRRHMILIHKKDKKKWRENTACHVNKRTDFFINVLPEAELVGDSVSSEGTKKEGEPEGNAMRNELHVSSGQENEQVVMFSHPSHVAPVLENVNDAPDTALTSSHDVILQHEQPVVRSMHPPVHPDAVEVKQVMESTNHNLCASVYQVDLNQPSMGTHQEVDKKPQEMIYSLPNDGLPLQTQILQSSASQGESTLSSSTHVPSDVTSLPHDFNNLATNDAMSTLPFGYSQNSYTLMETSGLPVAESLPQLQYAPMVTAQPYPQAILMVPNSLATLTSYSQEGINVPLPSTDQQASVQVNLNGNQVVLSSNVQISHLPQLSGPCDQILSPSQQQPQQ